MESRNQLLNLVREWEQPKPKDFVAECLKQGITPDLIERYGYGELKFILAIRDFKLKMQTNVLQRIDRELQEDMVILEKQESEGPVIQHIRKVFACATGHLSRAIRKSVMLYENSSSKKSYAEKKKLDNDIEQWHRKKSY